MYMINGKSVTPEEYHASVTGGKPAQKKAKAEPAPKPKTTRKKKTRSKK